MNSLGKGPRIECSICGFDVPLVDAVRHYKSRKWVDRKCADAISADDLRARVRLGREEAFISPQPVSHQGPDATISSGFGTKPFGPFPFGDPTS